MFNKKLTIEREGVEGRPLVFYALPSLKNNGNGQHLVINVVKDCVSLQVIQ